MIVMWTLVTGDPEGQKWWKPRYALTLEHIWATESYKASRMPNDVPQLAFVSPRSPEVLYFFLGDNMFVFSVLEN